jgi:hypothetical protein
MASKTAEPSLPTPTRQEQLTGADGSPFDEIFLFQLALGRDPE